MAKKYNRGMKESPSRLGQYVTDHVKRTFDWSDIDGNSMAQSTKIFRIFEEKRAGQGLKESQKRLLPIWARMVEWGVKEGFLAPGSGVFLIEVIDADVESGLTPGFEFKVFKINEGRTMRRVPVDDIDAFLGCKEEKESPPTLTESLQSAIDLTQEILGPGTLAPMDDIPSKKLRIPLPSPEQQAETLKQYETRRRI